MIVKQTVIQNPTGLHARPAAQLVALCKGFISKITLSSRGSDCDGKSIFGVLRCCMGAGDTVIVTARGPDEAEAAEAVVRFIEALEE